MIFVLLFKRTLYCIYYLMEKQQRQSQSAGKRKYQSPTRANEEQKHYLVHDKSGLSVDIARPILEQKLQPPQNYTFGKTIGDGSFGKVKLGIHKLTRQRVAIKILYKERIKQKADIDRISLQIKIMKKVRHPFVVQLYEIIEVPKYLYLIMEYVEHGDLFNQISQATRLTESRGADILAQIMLGLQYLHDKGITHRDMKPENILISADGIIKIADFGLGSMFEENQKLKTACGSPCYAPPQMLNLQEYDPKKVDIWSCGIILYAMVHGYLPFEDSVTSQLYEKIRKKNFRVASWVTIPCRNLIRGMLIKDQNQRWSLDTVKEHQFLKEQIKYFQDTVEKQTSEIHITEFKGVCQYLGIDEEERLLSNLKKNRHNNLTTLYYLGKKRMIRQVSLELNQELQKQKHEINKSDEKVEKDHIQKEQITNNSQDNELFQNLPVQDLKPKKLFSFMQQETMLIAQNKKEMPDQNTIIEEIDHNFDQQLRQEQKIDDTLDKTEKKYIQKTRRTQIQSFDNRLNSPTLQKKPLLKKVKKMSIIKPKKTHRYQEKTQKMRLHEISHSKEKPIILKNNLTLRKSRSKQKKPLEGSFAIKSGGMEIEAKLIYGEPLLIDVKRLVLSAADKFCHTLSCKGFYGFFQYFRYHRECILINKVHLKNQNNVKISESELEKVINHLNLS